jgi:transcriptional regulator with GAF, ATPase, and Fis domain
VHVDCAALSPALIESELFGHERGAFTGASATRHGRFELAGPGTIFLDEIGDLDESLQTKLLRLLEERRFERVGGNHTLAMRARVVAATSRPLAAAVREGAFRRDLYFRLAVLRLELPPLRQRLDDLPELIDAGLERICARLARLGLERPGVAPELYAHLAAHPWPGNVRELFNALERALVQGEVCGRLDPASFAAALEPELAVGEPDAQGPSWSVDDQLARVREALLGSGGNVARAARRLGLPRGTLRYRIERLGLKGLIPRD